MWEDRKKQELEEAAIAVPRCYGATQGISPQYYRNHVKMKGELF
jgi:hypothetical protein